MYSVPTSKIARRRRSEVKTLPDVILRNDYLGQLEKPEVVIAEAEARAINSRPSGAICKRTRANQLHQEGDRLSYKGDYESALVLYHRASKLYPQESKHTDAVSRMQAAITSASNPSKELQNQMKDARSLGKMSVLFSTEDAARRAHDVIDESQDPMSYIPRVLRFFESRKDFWRLSSPSTSPHRSRSKMMLKKLNKSAMSTFKELQTAYEAGDKATVHELGNTLVDLVAVSEEPNRNQLDFYGYLANRQITLKRHDRALDLAAKMLFLARTCGNVRWIAEGLFMLGKVHLAFGHFHALVHVWERLVGELQSDATSQAWLYHDIGRCHLELDNYDRAFNNSKICLQIAETAQSKKWIIRGQLLVGQSLLKLNKFGEAVVALKSAAMIILEEGNEKEKPIITYIQNLIDQVACVLRQFNQKRKSISEPRKSCSKETDADSVANTVSIATDLSFEDTVEVNSLVSVTEKPTVPKQRKRPHRDRTRSNKEDESSDDEKVAQLLEKMRGLRRTPTVQSTLKIPEDDAQSSDCENCQILTPELEELDLNTSRTRIIESNDSDTNSDDDKMLRANELTVLSDFSCADDVGEEDFTSTKLDDPDMLEAEIIQNELDAPSTSRSNCIVVSKEFDENPALYFSGSPKLASSGVSHIMDNEVFSSTVSDNHSENKFNISKYLKTLKSQDFVELSKKEMFFSENHSLD